MAESLRSIFFIKPIEYLKSAIRNPKSDMRKYLKSKIRNPKSKMRKHLKSKIRIFCRAIVQSFRTTAGLISEM